MNNWNTINTSMELKYKVKEITSILEQHSDVSPNLMNGAPGLALYFFYLHKLTLDEKHYDKGMEFLSSALTYINNSIFEYPTFAGGLAGFGWTIKHLIRENFIDADPNDLLGDLDEILMEKMKKEIESKNLDFLHGAIGISMYFLNRIDDNRDVVGYIEYLLNFLQQYKEIENANQIKWLFKSVMKEDESYNLSLSHGLCNLLYFLAKCIKSNIQTEEVKDLLEKSVNYLLSNKIDPHKYNSYFPSIIKPGKQPTGSRLAWCYGDLGIGITLWQIAEVMDNKKWKDEAMEILLFNTSRRDIKKNMVTDTGLCHGASGIAHIFNRLYHFTNNIKFKDTANYWYRISIEQAVFSDGLAGYKTFRLPEQGGLTNTYGLLEGITGIGLSFISAISDIDPKWDECLLLSNLN